MQTRKPANPQSPPADFDLPHLNSNYDLYEKSRQQRKELARQRRQLEDSVSQLRREAEETQRKYNQTQGQLTALYQKKISAVDYEHQRVNQEKRRQKDLQQRRNISSLSRYLNQIKRQENKEKLASKHKKARNQIREHLLQSEATKRSQKNAQIQQLQERNKFMNQTLKVGVQWARNRSLEQKKKISKSVRNELISIETSQQQREQDTIARLQREREEIERLLNKTKQKQLDASNIKSQLQKMDLYDFETKLQQNEKLKESRFAERSQRGSRAKSIPRHHSTLLM